MALRLSVRPSYAGIASKRVDGSSWFIYGIEATLAYATLCYKEIRVSPKVRMLPSRSLFRTLNLANFPAVFAAARRSSQMLSP